MTVSLTQVIVARSSVPSVGHSTLKVGHSTSQKVQSFAGFIQTPWSPEKLSLMLASMVWSTVECFDPDEPILYVPGDYQCHRTDKGKGLPLRERPHRCSSGCNPRQQDWVWLGLNGFSLTG
jgi:hypothetical protein